MPFSKIPWGTFIAKEVKATWPFFTGMAIMGSAIVAVTNSITSTPRPLLAFAFACRLGVLILTKVSREPRYSRVS
eukprot:4934497-Pyramimonas_sp.AAC.3